MRTFQRFHSVGLVFLGLIFTLGLAIPHGDEGWLSSLLQHSDAENSILFWEFRVPRIIMGLSAGVGLSISGLLLQTLFQNPLAGPSILGLTSGAHLFVALAVLSTNGVFGFLRNFSLPFAAGLGAFLFGLLLLFIAGKVRLHLSLLLIGIMIGTFVSALTNVLLTQADPNAIKSFTMWSFGSLSQATLQESMVVFFIVLIGALLVFRLTKSLDLLLLGQRQAKVLGVHLTKVQWWIITITALLSGIVTAYSGPIAFVGLVVPNLVRMFYKTSNHRVLLLGSILLGASYLMLCDLLTLFLEEWIILPINTLTSLLGAPVVIFLLLKHKTHA